MSSGRKSIIPKASKRTFQPPKTDKPKHLSSSHLKPNPGNLPNPPKRHTLGVLFATEEWLRSRRLQQIYANRTQDPHFKKISPHPITFLAIKITIISRRERHILCWGNKKVCYRIKGHANWLISGNTKCHFNKTCSKQRKSYRRRGRLSEAA